jgi:hypothetical protein
MNRPPSSQIVALVLLGIGAYQIIAAILSGFLWLANEDCLTLMPQISVAAFWLTLPIAYLIWAKYLRHL